MATQKKKTTSVAKKQTAKKPVAKKIILAVKKVGTSKVVAKKVAAKKPVGKTIQDSKKPVYKKAVAAKKTIKPIIKSALAKKSAKPVVKKADPKKLSNTNTKTGAKKAGATPAKKSAQTLHKKPDIAVKKPIVIKAKVTPQKSIEKAVETPVVNINDHKKELKKALKKAVKNDENKKPAKPFVMPKTNTEKARKYEPQFIKSVLDHAPEEDNGPSMRYSDNELNEFKELISRKLETAKKELGYLQGLITRKDEMGGDDTDNRYMTMEDGSLSMEREQLSQMASRQITFIDHLEKAMMRIENKTYGICRVTGKLIDKARLRAVPHATLSIEAKMGIAR
ncbi:MAG: TraR/DksA C4-type zinc finger protein [Ginsengibacter sp.]